MSKHAQESVDCQMKYDIDAQRGKIRESELKTAAYGVREQVLERRQKRGAYSINEVVESV